MFTAFSQSFTHTQQKFRGRGENSGRDDSKGKYGWVGGGVKCMMFKKYEEVVDLCGPMNLWEEYVIGEFSGWDMFQN